MIAFPLTWLVGKGFQTLLRGSGLKNQTLAIWCGTAVLPLLFIIWALTPPLTNGKQQTPLAAWILSALLVSIIRVRQNKRRLAKEVKG